MLMQSTQGLGPHYPLGAPNETGHYVNKNPLQSTAELTYFPLLAPRKPPEMFVKNGEVLGDPPNLPNQKVRGAERGNVHF